MTLLAPPRLAVTREFPCTAAELHKARHWVGDVLGPLFGRDDDVVFRVSVCLGELLVNALRHSDSGRPGGTVQVTVIVDESRRGVRIEVLDAGSADVPHMVPESVTGEGGPLTAVREDGRGLRIVSNFADQYGENRRRDGRVTWAHVEAM